MWLCKVILIYGGVRRVAPDIISRNGPLNVIISSTTNAPLWRLLSYWCEITLDSLDVAPGLFYFRDICSSLCQAEKISPSLEIKPLRCALSKRLSWVRVICHRVLFVLLVVLCSPPHPLTVQDLKHNSPKTVNSLNIYLQSIQHVDEFASSSDLKILALHHLLICGSIAVNGCRQNESPNSWHHNNQGIQSVN